MRSLADRFALEYYRLKEYTVLASFVVELHHQDNMPRTVFYPLDLTIQYTLVLGEHSGSVCIFPEVCYADYPCITALGNRKKIAINRQPPLIDFTIKFEFHQFNFVYFFANVVDVI